MVALICEYFLYPVNDIPRLVHYFFQQSLEILSRSVFHVHLTFFRLINQAGIFHCSSVGVGKIFTRSGGVPGLATIGRPRSPLARITRVSWRPTSGVLY